MRDSAEDIHRRRGLVVIDTRLANQYFVALAPADTCCKTSNLLAT
jgi:hypothetical protein